MRSMPLTLSLTLLLMLFTACSNAPTDGGDAGIQVGTSTTAHVPPVVIHTADAPPPVLAPILVVHFSPSGGCTDMVVKLIQSASVRVHLFAYSFTSQPVVAALIGAKRQGVEVIVVLDKTDLKNPRVKDLRAAGIPVYIDSKHAIMHEKVTIVDRDRFETGSFNYTFAAETKNAENCLRVDDVPGIVDLYEQNFQLHKGHSVAVR